MKIHTLPAIGLVLLTSLSSCKKDQTALEIEILRDQARSVELSQKVRLLEMRWERLGPSHELAELASANVEKSTQLLTDMRLEREQLTVDIAKIEKDLALAEQKHKNHLRMTSIGKEYPKFAAKHRVYEDVTVVEVDHMGIQIRHKDGLSRVTASKLTLDQMMDFGIDPEIAHKAQLDEAKQIAAYNKMVDTELAKRKAQERIAAAYAPSVPTPVVASTSRSTRPSNFGKMSSSYSSYGTSSRTRRYRSSYYSGPTIYYYNAGNSGSSSNYSSNSSTFYQRVTPKSIFPQRVTPQTSSPTVCP